MTLLLYLNMCELFTYATDNTACVMENGKFRIKAETIIRKMLDLFHGNKMKVKNPIQFV